MSKAVLHWQAVCQLFAVPVWLEFLWGRRKNFKDPIDHCAWNEDEKDCWYDLRELMSQEHNPDLNRNHFVWNHSAVWKGEKRKAGRRRLKRNWVGGMQVPARIDALLPSYRLCSIKTRNSGILHQSIVCHNCHQGVTHLTTRIPPSLNNQIKMKRRLVQDEN